MYIYVKIGVHQFSRRCTSIFSLLGFDFNRGVLGVGYAGMFFYICRYVCIDIQVFMKI